MMAPIECSNRPSNEFIVTWHFEECNCRLVRYTTIRGGKHLVAKPRIRSLDVQADRRTDFAVSYAYGKNNRKNQTLGHVDRTRVSRSPIWSAVSPSIDSDIVFELASEWDPRAFAETLVDLCKDDKYGWIDQMTKHEKAELQAKGYEPTPAHKKPPHPTESQKARPQRSHWSSTSERESERRSERGNEGLTDSNGHSETGGSPNEPERETEKAGENRVIKRIPQIYRLFNVDVILPFRRCGCVRDSLNRDPRCWCINGIVLASWFSRLWTRQELMYASRVQFHWAGERLQAPSKSCVSVGSDNNLSWESFRDLDPILKDHLEDLFKIYACTGGTFADARLGLKIRSWQAPRMAFTATRTKYHRTMVRILPSANTDIPTKRSAWIQAVRELRNAQDFYVSLMRSAMCDYGKSADGALSFFGGKAIPAIPKNLSENARLDRFIESLFRLSRSNRRATKLRDYVEAVFVDLPEYEPYTEEDGAKEVPLSTLTALDTPMQQLLRRLRHAIKQLKTKHGLMLLTTTPLGLFCTEDDPRSWRWDPSQYMNVASLDWESLSAKDVYGSLFPHSPILLNFERNNRNRKAYVPLTMSHADEPSLSQRSSSYKAWLYGRPWPTLETPIQNTIANWPPQILRRCQRPEVDILRRMLAQNPALKTSVRSIESIAIQSPLVGIGASMLKETTQPGTLDIMVKIIFIRNQRKRKEALAFLRFLRLGVNVADDFSRFICKSLPAGVGNNPFVARKLGWYIKKEQRRIIKRYKEDGVLKAQIDAKIFDEMMDAVLKQVKAENDEAEEGNMDERRKVVSKPPTEHGHLETNVRALVNDHEATKRRDPEDTSDSSKPYDPSSASSIANHQGVLRKIVLDALGLHQRLDGLGDPRLELVMTDPTVSPPSLGIFNKEKFADAKDGLLETKTLALTYADGDGGRQARRNENAVGEGYGTLMYEVYASGDAGRCWKVFGVWVPQVRTGTANLSLASPGGAAASDIHWLE